MYFKYLNKRSEEYYDIIIIKYKILYIDILPL